MAWANSFVTLSRSIPCPNTPFFHTAPEYFRQLRHCPTQEGHLNYKHNKYVYCKRKVKRPTHTQTHTRTHIHENTSVDNTGVLSRRKSQLKYSIICEWWYPSPANNAKGYIVNSWIWNRNGDPNISSLDRSQIWHHPVIISQIPWNYWCSWSHVANSCNVLNHST